MTFQAYLDPIKAKTGKPQPLYSRLASHQAKQLDIHPQTQ